MAAGDPTKIARRSPLLHGHRVNNASFSAIGGSCLVESYSCKAGIKNEITQSQSLAICDLTTLPRTGFKGSGALAWLHDQGFDLPVRPNLAIPRPNGCLIAKLSDQEALILSDIFSLSTDVIDLNNKSLECHSEVSRRTYVLPRGDSHCWLAVTGSKASEMFSKICAVDLRTHKFSSGSISQTSLAKVNSIIIRNDLGNTPCFYVLSDISSTEFLWDCILDAMQEYQGTPVGVLALQSHVNEH